MPKSCSKSEVTSSPTRRLNPSERSADDDFAPFASAAELATLTSAFDVDPADIRRGKPLRTIAVALIALTGGASYYAWGHYTAETSYRASRALREAARELKRDSSDSYQNAIAAAELALRHRRRSGVAHGMLAYAYAIRWGEHAGGDLDRRAAEAHLAAGLETADRSVWLFAAEALVPYYAGDSKTALEKIGRRIEETGSRSGLLFLTQGIVMMNDGDLDGAPKALEKALQLEMDAPRIYSTLGVLNRRRGLDREALQNFDNARRFERYHVDSILGTAMLVLEQLEPGGGYISQATALRGVVALSPAPSPRQLAVAHALMALLISRASADFPLYPLEFRKRLAEAGFSADASQACVEEDIGFRLDPLNPELFLIRGKRAFFEGRLDAALVEIRKAIRLNPKRAHFRIELGKVLIAKNAADAELELRQSLTSFPADKSLLTLLGSSLYAQKRLDDATEVLTRAGADPLLCKIWRDEKKEIDPALESCIRAAKYTFGARLATDIAELFETRGDDRSARAWWDKAGAADPDDTRAACGFLKFLRRTGETTTAAHWKELGDRCPSTAPAAASTRRTKRPPARTAP